MGRRLRTVKGSRFRVRTRSVRREGRETRRDETSPFRNSSARSGWRGFSSILATACATVDLLDAFFASHEDSSSRSRPIIVPLAKPIRRVDRRFPASVSRNVEPSYVCLRSIVFLGIARRNFCFVQEEFHRETRGNWNDAWRQWNVRYVTDRFVRSISRETALPRSNLLESIDAARSIPVTGSPCTETDADDVSSRSNRRQFPTRAPFKRILGRALSQRRPISLVSSEQFLFSRRL